MANEEHLARLQEAVDKNDIRIWNKWREKNPHLKPDLNDANLSSMHLAGADFSGAKFGEANFFRATLGRANLKGAFLSSANLRRANLCKADLGAANLNGADLALANLNNASLVGAKLIGANLVGATLKRAALSQADFSNAKFGNANVLRAYCHSTKFAAVDLGSVKRLETLIHLAPSFVGIETIYKSKGKIPDVFLRGAGVPEIFLKYLPSITDKPVEFYSCFISYSRKNQLFARRLHDALQERGIRCWLDEKHVISGYSKHIAVDRHIHAWDKVLFCCSKYSLRSWWVDKEMAAIFKKEQRRAKDRGENVSIMIPLNLDGCLFSDNWRSDYRTQVRKRLAADFAGWETDDRKFKEQLEHIVQALRIEMPPELRAAKYGLQDRQN